MTKRQRARLQAQVTELEGRLAELQAVPEKDRDEDAIRDTERVLIRRKKELDRDFEPAAPAPERPPAETPAA